MDATMHTWARLSWGMVEMQLVFRQVDEYGEEIAVSCTGLTIDVSDEAWLDGPQHALLHALKSAVNRGLRD